jgi:hypothetical protein
MDPSLRTPEVNCSPGPEYGDEKRMFQGIPGIERAANGRLWALWYSGGTTEGDDNFVLLVTSDDDGATWSGPKVVIDPPGAVRAYDACLWCDPLGRLWVFWAQSYHLWDGRSGVWAIASEDADRPEPTWSAPRRLGNGIALNKPTVLTNGEWLLPASVWERPAGDFPEREYRCDLGEEAGANVFVSADEGATWEMRGQALVPNRVFDEHMIVERRDCSLWMLVRTMDGMGESFSEDGGKRWSGGRKAAISHVNSRFFIRRLLSGHLLLVKHSPPEGAARSHLSAYLSEDDGETWSGGLMLDERLGVSYPDGVQAPDGRIYIIYDYQRHADKQILMAVVTEEDIVGGACVAETARLRVLVNQATGENPNPK